MKSKTHIFILHMKEIVFTVIFVILAIILIIVLISVFGGKKDTETMSHGVMFNPGTYDSVLSIGSYQATLSVRIDEEGIENVSLTNTDQDLLTMYPLLETCVRDISAQLSGGTPLNQVQYSDSNKNTMHILVEAINNAMQKAAP